MGAKHVLTFAHGASNDGRRSASEGPLEEPALPSVAPAFAGVVVDSCPAHSDTQQSETTAVGALRATACSQQQEPALKEGAARA